MPQLERNREIRRRRQRQAKLHVLRIRLEKERDSKVRARLIAKIRRISPLAPVPEK